MNLLQKMPIGQYVPGESVIHRLDPRSKMLMLLWYMVLVFTTGEKWFDDMILAFIVVAVIGLSKISVRYLLDGLKPFLWILLFTMLLHMFTTRGGEVWWAWSVFEIHEQGVYQGFYLSVRLLLFIMMASVVTLTTSPLDLTDGVERMLSPLRRIGVPVHEIALMMSMALRFIPTLGDETEKIMKAQAARGARFYEGSVLRRLRNLVPVFVPLLVATFRRAEELAVAMEARGYRGAEGRTKRRQLCFTTADVWAVVVAVIVSAVLLVI